MYIIPQRNVKTTLPSRPCTSGSLLMPWCEEGAAAVLLHAREMIYLTA